MVTKYGMSDLLGPITFGSERNEIFLGKDYGTVRNYSETIASEIDEEVNHIIIGSYRRCEELIRTHIDKLGELADYLVKNEKIDAVNFLKLMDAPAPESVTE